MSWKWWTYWIACALIGALIGLMPFWANAATVRMYTPGGAPCAGACTLEWAAQEFEVPIGEPQRMIIPKGAYITKMSYGKDGQPYWHEDSAMFADDQPGQGYLIEGTDLWMVQIDECQNWAIVRMPEPVVNWSSPPTPTYVNFIPPGTPSTPWEPPPPGCIFCEPPPPCEVDCGPPPPPPPAPVPLPAPALLLLGAVGSLFLTRGRRTA